MIDNCNHCNVKYDKNMINNLSYIQKLYSICETCCINDFFVRCNKCKVLTGNAVDICVDCEDNYNKYKSGTRTL
jgi:hypothetical protein